MINALLGLKHKQSQYFLADGTRIPVTEVDIPDNPVVFIKTKEKHMYSAIQLGIGTKKHSVKALLGHVRGAQIEKAPQFLREIRVVSEEELIKLGQRVKAEEVFRSGDIVDVTGLSKGKGFAGVVKRHHFKGGPRTHGQSDRERAPGSIGQTTTPGRVYKGKRMAGRMGHEKVTIKNLQVVNVDADNNKLFLKGLVPGVKNSLLVIQKVYQKVKKE